MWTKPLSVAETILFSRQAADVWSDEERSDFVDFIARNPEAGDLIQDTGGVRKVRWSRQGSGKRGGVRVIYFYTSIWIRRSTCSWSTPRPAARIYRLTKGGPCAS
jgi:mRNA-degrading endonuclease RelE of RelBE toxin-antitoxin system